MCLTDKFLFENTYLFESNLPGYLADKALTGKYVVFYQGKIYAKADNRTEAYSLARKLFTENEAFVVRKVSPRTEVEEELLAEKGDLLCEKI